jgi:lipopolysaccharide export system protein LptA
MKSNFFLAFLLCMLAFSSLAKDSDFAQAVNVSSDNFGGSIEDKKLVYLGNVVVTQGSLSIKADKLEVDRSAGEGKEVFIATGQPAEYSQLLDGDKPIQAMANEIRYDFATRILTLTGKAEINQSGSLVRSAMIQYDLAKQSLKASSGKDNERVSTIFTPEKK